MSYYKLGDNFKWFIARVSDLKDPEYLGRVKIRVIHQQTGELGKVKKNKGVHNDDLLWAWPLSSIQSASLSWRKLTEKNVGLEEFDTPDWIDAVGVSPTGIAKGTYVFGFYLDAFEQNIPIIFGTYHKRSIYPEPPSDDPNENSLLQLEPPSDPKLFFDVAALARGEDGAGGQTLPKEPYTEARVMTVTNEPETAYKTEYPYNTTYTTKSGHAVEFDDTPGHERIHIWHKSGSYEEIANGPPEDGPSYKGRRVKKTTDSDYEVVLKDKNVLIKKNLNKEVGNNVTVSIGEDATIAIEGHATVVTGGGLTIAGDGGVTIASGMLTVAESVSVGNGANGSFSTPDGQTVSVVNGIVVGITR